MERLTEKGEDGHYRTRAPKQDVTDRLGALEDMWEFVEKQMEENSRKMERLKADNKTKSVQYREALGRKLMNEQMLQMIHLFSAQKK